MSKGGRAIFGGVVALGLVSSGSAIGYRSRLVAQRREEIAMQQREVENRVGALEASVRSAEAAHHRNMRDAQEMETVVNTIWQDRRKRYDKTVRDMESYLVAAPESIGVLQGIIHHGKFLESVLPSFVRFDGRTHQINSLLLTLTAGRSLGINRVAPDLVKYHGYDPYVKALGEHATSSIGNDEAPRTVKEVSDAFSFCHSTLQKAIDDAQSRLVMERTVVPRSPSLVTQALSAALGTLKAREETSTLDTSREELERLKRHQADSRVLSSHTDVRAALMYTDQLMNKYHRLISEAKESAQPTPFADEEVVEAVKQFFVWRQSVVTFLLRDQAQRALDSYAHCITDTATQLVNDGLPDALKNVPAAA